MASNNSNLSTKTRASTAQSTFTGAQSSPSQKSTLSTTSSSTSSTSMLSAQVSSSSAIPATSELLASLNGTRTAVVSDTSTSSSPQETPTFNFNSNISAITRAPLRPGPPSLGPPPFLNVQMLGGVPSTMPDLPASSLALFLFFLGLVGHFALFQRNNARNRFFPFNMAMAIFCLLRLVTMSLRISWTEYAQNARLALAASVFVQAGTVILYIVNGVFLYRIIKAQHRSVGASRLFRLSSRFLILATIGTLFILIVAGVQAAFTAKPSIRATCRTLQLFGTTFFAAIAILPIPIIILSQATYKPSFGAGDEARSHTRKRFALVFGTSLLLTIRASWICGTVWSAPLPPTALLPWYFTKPVFYLVVILPEVFVVLLLLFGRADRYLYHGTLRTFEDFSNTYWANNLSYSKFVTENGSGHDVVRDEEAFTRAAFRQPRMASNFGRGILSPVVEERTATSDRFSSKVKLGDGSSANTSRKSNASAISDVFQAAQAATAARSMHARSIHSTHAADFPMPPNNTPEYTEVENSRQPSPLPLPPSLTRQLSQRSTQQFLDLPASKFADDASGAMRRSARTASTAAMLSFPGQEPIRIPPPHEVITPPGKALTLDYPLFQQPSAHNSINFSRTNYLSGQSRPLESFPHDGLAARRSSGAAPLRLMPQSLKTDMGGPSNATDAARVGHAAARRPMLKHLTSSGRHISYRQRPLSGTIHTTNSGDEVMMDSEGWWKRIERS